MRDFTDAVPVTVRTGLLNNQLKGWQNTYVDAGYSAQIAETIGNKQLAEQSMERMAQALKAIDWIEAKITELEAPIDKAANP